MTITSKDNLTILLNPVEERILDEIKARSWTCPLISIGALKAAEISSVRTLENSLHFLARQGVLNLFEHDFPAGMTAEEREGALWVGKRAYNAVSIRQ